MVDSVLGLDKQNPGFGTPATCISREDLLVRDRVAHSFFLLSPSFAPEANIMLGWVRSGGVWPP